MDGYLLLYPSIVLLETWWTGYNSILDDVVRTAAILPKICIRPLHGFFLKNVTAETRLLCIVNPAYRIRIHRRGSTVYKFVSLATN